MTEDFKDISDKLDVLKGIMENHITATNIYRKTQGDKISKLEHLIDGNEHPGLKTKVDRLETAEINRNSAEKNRSKIIWGSVTAISGIILDKFFHFLPK